jgi:limonene-1,2-epoxide hydrolase
MDPQAIVREFIAAIERQDVEAAAALLSDDIRYENMPIDPIVGRDGVVATLSMFLEPASEVEWPVLRQVVDGNCVINERLDRFKIGDGWLELPVAGVFEITDGTISLWRDYFDMGAYQRQLAELTEG